MHTIKKVEKQYKYTYRYTHLFEYNTILFKYMVNEFVLSFGRHTRWTHVKGNTLLSARTHLLSIY